MVEEGLNVLEKRDINMVEVFSTALKPVQIQPDELTVEEALCIAKRLKSVHVNETGDDSSQSVNRKKSPELPDLLGISDIRHIDLAKLWAYRVGKERLRVPIGLFDDTSTAFLDIKEMGQHGMGPHGVLVGATGSKSEVLRTPGTVVGVEPFPGPVEFRTHRLQRRRHFRRHGRHASHFIHHYESRQGSVARRPYGRRAGWRSQPTSGAAARCGQPCQHHRI